MKKLFVKLALITLLATLASSCYYQYQFPFPTLVFGLCAESCLNPIYANCPPTIYDPFTRPEYCGLTAQNVWKNFTFTCSVCGQGTTNKGYYFGPCTCQNVQCFRGQKCVGGNCVKVPTCDTIKCQSGYECKNAECVPIVVPPECTKNSNCAQGEVCDKGKCRAKTCNDIVCADTYDTCEFGVCFRKYDYFCNKVTPRIERHYCELDRPTEVDCPYFPPTLPPAHTVCGVATNGDLLDYQSICEACKRDFVGYVYNTSCAQVPAQCAKDTERCIDGECVHIDVCANVPCPSGYKCNNGICVAVTTCNCPDGYHCAGGSSQCVANDLCAAVSCAYGEKCINGDCIDKCSLLRCPLGSHCKLGDCITDSDPNGCPNQPCAYGYHCVNGKDCVKDDNGSGNGSGSGNGNGSWQDKSCSTNRECVAGEVCIGNFCQEKFCSFDWQCYGSGSCINRKCNNSTPRG